MKWFAPSYFLLFYVTLIITIRDNMDIYRKLYRSSGQLLFQDLALVYNFAYVYWYVEGQAVVYNIDLVHFSRDLLMYYDPMKFRFDMNLLSFPLSERDKM
ncbi:hypothetical protein BCR42DRAFT_416354 [Absidia repens]|uniref:Uncharacterized protein n=1 Tax=Absidia repens TaxID=90262 RepID=A0A1X2IEH7_9FUNG|nr:hypothetical protein BCR42DRAFT_416354 [Absidia repens]